MISLLIHLSPFFLSVIDGGAIITNLLEGSPTMAVAGLFGWFMYRENGKKDLALVESEKTKSALTERLIADKEKRILSEQEQINLLRSVVERIDGIPPSIKDGINRLERNQIALKEDIKELRNLQN